MSIPEVAQRARRAAGRVAGTTMARTLGIGEVIYLIAPTGYPNYGDELIARTWLRHLARVRPRATVVVDCHSPGQASLLHRGIHPHTLFVDTLWQLSEFAAAAPKDSDDGPDPDQPWTWMASTVTDPGRSPRLSAGIEILNRASTIHLLGGGYVNKVWPQHVSLVAAAAAVSRATGATAVASGQGLIPCLDEPAWTALVDAAGAFSVFDVRDDASADALTAVPHATNSGDDAWLSLHRPASNVYRRMWKDRGVVLCLQSDLTDEFRGPESTGVAALTDLVRSTLDKWDVAGSDVTVIEGIPGYDNEVAHRLGDRLDGATRIPFRDVWLFGLPAGEGQTWISTRFHPHLMAAAAGDSGVAIVPMPEYYSTKHRSLTDLGSAWTIADDGTTVPDPPFRGGFTPEDRQRAIDAKTALAKRIYPDSPSRSLRRG
ncbi:polysaccharide pyruvyl transferase family protein [Gordonia sp. ABSL49_1]|uniref:polysaccharide pyruvyl transferase family protein n=1 Tax=unclassified Gordonia (in: high G+C Gram-positive bacteria) TaxID=2657482 RepID=UPI001F0FBE84|nr:polysaccharide pyruvyl transferase family protein [Gordonia sp. ABSL49_1]MCH5642690.1 polysaccharide pyruvyl transferase family protein [Gordonia sp. ABSL49_1]